MKWNYRVVYHPSSKLKIGDTEFEIEIGEYLAIHEVFYDKNGCPNAMTIDEIVTGEEGIDSLLSLRWILEKQLESLEKPIIENQIENKIYKEISQEKQNEFSKSIKNKEQNSSKDIPIADGHTDKK